MDHYVTTLFDHLISDLIDLLGLLYSMVMGELLAGNQNKIPKIAALPCHVV